MIKSEEGTDGKRQGSCVGLREEVSVGIQRLQKFVKMLKVEIEVCAHREQVPELCKNMPILCSQDLTMERCMAPGHCVDSVPVLQRKLQQGKGAVPPRWNIPGYFSSRKTMDCAGRGPVRRKTSR